VFLGILFLITIVTAHHRLTHLQGYHYPEWSTHFGWTLSVIPIFIFIITGMVVVGHRFRKFSPHSLSLKKRLWMAMVWSVQPGKLLRLEPESQMEKIHPQNRLALKEEEGYEVHRNYGYYTSSSDVVSTCSSNYPHRYRSPPRSPKSPRMTRSPLGHPPSPRSLSPHNQSSTPSPRIPSPTEYNMGAYYPNSGYHDQKVRRPGSSDLGIPYEIPLDRPRLPSDFSDFSSVSQHKEVKNNNTHHQQNIFRYPPDPIFFTSNQIGLHHQNLQQRHAPMNQQEFHYETDPAHFIAPVRFDADQPGHLYDHPAILKRRAEESSGLSNCTEQLVRCDDQKLPLPHPVNDIRRVSGNDITTEGQQNISEYPTLTSNSSKVSKADSNGDSGVSDSSFILTDKRTSPPSQRIIVLNKPTPPTPPPKPLFGLAKQNAVEKEDAYVTKL